MAFSLELNLVLGVNLQALIKFISEPVSKMSHNELGDLILTKFKRPSLMKSFIFRTPSDGASNSPVRCPPMENSWMFKFTVFSTTCFGAEMF